MAAEPAPAGRSLPGRSVAGDNRILTVPNAVTTVRLGCVPVFVILVAAGRHHWFAAAALLAVLGITDGVDGFIARRFNQVSSLGKVLDPLADRLLLGAAAISILVVGALPTVVAVLALGREAVVAAGFLAVALAGGRRIDVSLTGKAQTLLLMCALPLFLAGHSTISWHRGAEVAAWVAAVPGIALGWYSAAGYVRPALRAVAESRAERPARTGRR